MWIVDDSPTPTPDFATIQAAVNAAAPGDTIVVQPGDYASFTLDSKPLQLLGHADAFGNPPKVSNGAAPTILSGIAASQTLLVRGLRFDGLLRAENSQGTIALEDCSGKLPLRATAADLVVVTRCSASGGFEISSGKLYVYDSSLSNQNPGASGVLATNSMLFLSGSTLTGAAGSFGASGGFPLGFCGDGGPGGAGLKLVNSNAYALACSLAGGPGGPAGTPEPGFPPCSNGSAGPAVSGPGFVALPGSAHSLWASSPVQEAESLQLALRGIPGEHSFAMLSAGQAPLQILALNGVLIVQSPWVLIPTGIVPATGEIALSVPIQELGAGVASGVVHAQPVFVHPSQQGPDFLGAPSSVLLVDRLVPLDDCNNDDLDDGYQIAGGALPDCNGNGVPDACDIAAQTSFDCNGNLVPDSCDIALGASLDANGNGYPDECEQLFTVPSAAHPTLQSALAAAPDFSTIVLLDGIHTGNGFKNLSFGGKKLVVRSLNGPANCVIDLQGSGRALSFDQHETQAAQLVGLTIRNGLSPGLFATGGALYIRDASPRIENCVFLLNAATYAGGAIGIEGSGGQLCHPSVIGCTFAQNRSNAGTGDSLGGAIWVGPAAGASALPAVVLALERCAFSRNRSDYPGGGALYLANCQASVRDSTFFANHGDRGGALSMLWSETQLSGCTLVANDAWEGGACAAFGSSAFAQTKLSVANSVLWQNTANYATSFYSISAQSIDVSYSIQAGSASTTPPSSYHEGPGVGSANPLLVDSAGGDLHLTASSPCIDAGDPAFAPLPGELDIDGQPRVNPPRIDMGADERHP